VGKMGNLKKILGWEYNCWGMGYNFLAKKPKKYSDLFPRVQ